MATRGTYKIDGLLMYNHWDNYPEGTALHLHKIITSQKGIDLFSCIRGLDSLQEATSIFDGPAEYHYVIDSKKGIIETYKLDFEEGKFLRDIQEIEVFINTHIENYSKRLEKAGHQFFDEGETLQNMKVIKTGTNQYNIIKEVEEEVKNIYNQAKEEFLKESFYRSKSLFVDAFHKMNKAGIKIEQLINDYLKNYCDILADKNGDINNPYFKEIVNR